jgi:hypothetical protein
MVLALPERSAERVQAYIQGPELDIGILVTYTTLENTHGLLWRHCLGSNDVGYLQVEGHILAAYGVSTIPVYQTVQSGMAMMYIQA